MSISERALLADLIVTTWSGTKVDKKVTEDVSIANKADLKKAGAYNKKLVADHYLSPIRSVISAATNAHNILTLPWEHKGKRIFAVTGHQHYTDTMRKYRIQFEAEREKLASMRDAFIQEAKPRLGGMFNEDEYPTSSEIEGKFSFDVEIAGVPEASDFRAKLTDGTVKSITKDIEQRAERRIEQAMNDVFERVLKVTGNLVEKLKNYEAPVGRGKGEKGKSFHDSTIYNIQELADLLPSLNVMGDKRLDDLQDQLKRELTTIAPVILKSDAQARLAVEKKAQKIYDKVAKMMA